MNKKTKVLLIHPSDPMGKKVGGVETFINGFIKAAPADVDIEFIGITSDEKLRPSGVWSTLMMGEKAFKFFPLFPVKDENKKSFIPLSLIFTTYLFFQKLNLADRVLFFHRIEPILAFTKSKNPKIVIVHNDIQKQVTAGKSEVLWSFLPGLYYKFEENIFRSLDLIYTVSSANVEFYSSRYPDMKEKFVFLPTWVDISIFSPINEPKNIIRAKLISKLNQNIDIAAKWFLFVGRLQEQKAPIRLIDTFHEYHKLDNKSYLLIIGEGNLKKSTVDHVEEMGLSSKVFFLNNMPQKEIADFYKASNVFVLTSNFEGMPMSVLEALSCGLPVVTTKVGEVERVVQNKTSGEVVSSFDPKIIAQKIAEVLNNSHLYNLNNCLLSVQPYSINNVLNPVYKLCKSFI